MRGVIRIGDKTTHGGVVISGSQNMKFGSIPVARVGDKVTCPIDGHGLTTIIEGAEHFRDHGVPVAFDGHHCACGCQLITSLFTAGIR